MKEQRKVSRYEKYLRGRVHILSVWLNMAKKKKKGIGMN